MDITLISGHKKDWNAGASKVYLHLDRELQKLGCNTHLFNAEDYVSDRLPTFVQKLVPALQVTNKTLEHVHNTDIVEVAGSIGWRLFQAIRSVSSHKRPLLAMRIHGLEFKDEQARIVQEIAGMEKLPTKYKIFTRHWLNWQEFKTIELADIVICHTSREVDAIVTSGLKHESQVKMCPLGVDSDLISSRHHRPTANKLLWWGSWVERKGIHSLPRAFELAVRELPHLELTIGGTQMSPEEIKSYFAPELSDRITVLPFVSKKEHQQILAEHDLFLFPSLSEGFGLALLEAMATSIPCITTLTGMYDWLEHGDNCYIVPMNAPTSIATAIKRLHADVNLRTTLGQQARQTAERLSWSKFGESNLSFYEESLSKIRGKSQLPLQVKSLIG
jgi:glycosyltransferase involved in cell wall biosynthesis